MADNYLYSEDGIRTFFLNKMFEYNMPPVQSDSNLIMDGNWQRYTIQGQKRGSNNGAYFIHTDNIPAGYIQDWANPGHGYKINMKDEDKPVYMHFDIKEIQEEQKKRRAEELKRQEKAAQFARAYYNGTFDGEFYHEYLINKQVQTHGIHLDNSKQLLVIPMRDIDGNIKNIQTISTDGTKRFYPGAVKKGMFFSIDLDKIELGDGKLILIGEGFATMAKVYELTGYPVVAAMDCGNIQPVAEAVHEKYPHNKIIIMADNDIKTKLKNGSNPGMDAAQKAINTKLAVGRVAPSFNEENPEGSDWDDYAIKFGNDAALDSIKRQIDFIFLPNDKKELLRKVECINAQTLKRKVFKPIVWAVDGFLPSGLSILAGGPKVGKSILALHLSLAVAIGGCALGKINVQQGDVLYLALEDTQRRLQERIQGSGLPDNCDLSRLSLVTSIPRQHEGGLAYIRFWLENHKYARLVIIDTLQMFRKQLSNKGNIYSEDYDTLAEIKKNSDEFNIPLLVIHHLKKAMADDWVNELSGSQGIAGAADTIFSLKRSRADNRGILHRTGRDVEEADFNMELDGFNWILMDEIESAAMTEWKRKIINYLKEHSSVTPMELSIALNMDNNKAQKQLQRLAKDGIITKTGRAMYSLPELGE